MENNEPPFIFGALVILFCFSYWSHSILMKNKWKEESNAPFSLPSHVNIIVIEDANQCEEILTLFMKRNRIPVEIYCSL